jgi:hypothetical protein|tara:strand:- start:1908 stop:2204 length:297 start_codon:yes stop_codon:yes gene_type:complete
MRYDLLKIWPSAILGCFLFGLAYEDGLRQFFWFFIIIWVFVGILSYSLNGKTHLKETLIDNVLGWLIIGLIIGLLVMPYYISFPLIALLAFIYHRWVK